MGFATLAGCSGGGGNGDDNSTVTDSSGSASNTTDDGTDDGTEEDTTDDGTGGDSLPTGFESLWELEVGIEDISGQYRTAHNGDFLAIGHETDLYAVDTAEQEVIWTYEEPGTVTGVVANDAHVFAHFTPSSGTGDTYGFRQSDGEVIEQRSGSWGTGDISPGESVPMVVLSEHVVVPFENQELEDTFYVLESDGGLVGPLMEEDGTIWVDGDGRNVVYGRNIGDDVEVVGKRIDDESNIERIWEIPDLVFDDTFVIDGTLVGVNDAEVLTLIEIESGEKREMSIEDEDFAGNRPSWASHDGTLFYTHDLSEMVYAIDPMTEEVLWSTEDELSRGTLLTVNGAVVLELQGEMRALDIESGEVLAEGENPQAGSSGSFLEPDEDVVYSCETMVQALDADF